MPNSVNTATVKFVFYMVGGGVIAIGLTLSLMLGAQEYLDDRLDKYTEVSEVQVAGALEPVQKGLEDVARRLKGHDRDIGDLRRRANRQRDAYMQKLLDAAEGGDPNAMRRLREFMKRERENR